jgi:hypothetical protein
VSQSRILETERAEAWAADVMRSAFGDVCSQRMASVCDLSRVRIDKFKASGAAFLRHMWALSARYPNEVRCVGQALVALCEPGTHNASPLPDRVCSVMAEVGDVARETALAWADHRITPDERARLRREIREAHAALEALERDIDAVTER